MQYYYNTKINKNKEKDKIYLKKIHQAYIIIKSTRTIKFPKEKELKQMATREKNIWILIIFILSGLVIGGLLGEVASKVDFLWWLGYGQSFGLSSPIQLDLNIVKITFGLMLKINIASIIGMAIAIFIYRKI